MELLYGSAITCNFFTINTVLHFINLAVERVAALYMYVLVFSYMCIEGIGVSR
jgi:hypothetical protein